MLLPALLVLTCTYGECERAYMAKYAGQRFCDRCEKKVRKVNGKGKKPKATRARMDEWRNCAATDCNARFKPKTGNQRFHKIACRDRVTKREQRAKKKAERIEQLRKENRLDDALRIAENAEQAKRGQRKRSAAQARSVQNVTAQRGEQYREFVDSGMGHAILMGDFTQEQVAPRFDVSAKTISAWVAAFREDLDLARAREEWSLSDEAERALNDFAYFRQRYFRTPEGGQYQMADFHRRWVDALLSALPPDLGGNGVRGRRVVVLSPPRAGKTELIAHLCLWLIIKNPNVRILWVGGNGDIAEQSGDLIRDNLETNEELAKDFLPPGEEFKPKGRSGKSWTNAKFTVATRTVSGIKSPTFAAVGCGGRLLSRDADLVIGDDIIDEESAWSPAEREKKAHWWNVATGSRKQNHTSVFAIGSRQHHLDLWGSLVDNPAWESIVESAHALDCAVPPAHPFGVPAGHDALESCPDCDAHQDCMLWPGNPEIGMHFLTDQRAAFENEANFEMVYFNLTRPDGAVFLTRADVDRCKNPHRAIGTGKNGRPITATDQGGLTLIAGLDPAQTSDQAAVLWGYDSGTRIRYLIDTDIQRGGGLHGAEEVIKRWHQQYGLKMWVIERNRYQDSIRQAKQITDYTTAHGIHLEPHFTDAQLKWNPDFGIPHQMQLFKTDPPKIDLPYAPEAETREKVDVYARQLLNFESEEAARKKKRKNDLVLSGWFPETKIRMWQAEDETSIEYQHGSTPYPALLGESYVYPGASGSGIALANDDLATVHDIETVRVA